MHNDGVETGLVYAELKDGLLRDQVEIEIVLLYTGPGDDGDAYAEQGVI